MCGGWGEGSAVSQGVCVERDNGEREVDNDVWREREMERDGGLAAVPPARQVRCDWRSRTVSGARRPLDPDGRHPVWLRGTGASCSPGLYYRRAV